MLALNDLVPESAGLAGAGEEVRLLLSELVLRVAVKLELLPELPLELRVLVEPEPELLLAVLPELELWLLLFPLLLRVLPLELREPL